MDPFEPFSAAMQYASLAMTSLQFFILICIAVGGWLFSGPRILSGRRFSWERWGLAAIFASATGTVAYGAIGLAERVNLAMAISRGRIPEDGSEQSRLLLEFFKAGSTTHVAWAFGFAILLISMMILMMEKRPGEEQS
ncbi:hypothetical protein KHP62_17565 [Rhodobacteraceae bacterium NNCM2]|nr:hypothetical protein [Coraliihabitans acroporae]